MLYQRSGWPEDDELVLCTVTSVQYNSVFCSLDEYPDKGGMIHISEVTAGRIRNIREYVQEGRKVVCKVLRTDKEKGHIDLSLRRVNERQRIEKNAALKQELKAENLLAHIAKERKDKPEELYKKVAPVIMEDYPYIHQAFEDIVADEYSLEDTKLDKKLAKEIEDLVRDRIKPQEVSIEGVFEIATFAEDGLSYVQKALIAGREASETADIRYLGGGRHKITITAEDYKQAEKRMGASLKAVEDAMDKVPSSTVKFTREE